MATKLEIINDALTSLRASKTTALYSDENGVKVQAIYENKLKAMLRSHPWSFAKKEVALAASTTTPVLDDYEYVYTLPTDFIRLLKTSVQPDYSHKIKDGELYSNSNAVSIEYIYYNEDPETYDSLFVDALSARIAAELAYPITGDKEVAKLKWQEYQAKMRAAKSENGQEVTPDTPQEDEWINARS